MRTFSRIVFGLTGLLSIIGMTMAATLAWGDTPQAVAALGGGLRPDVFDSAFSRVFNVFCYFTIQSNILICVISIILFVNPNRTSEVFRTFRIMALGAIIITGLVYNLILLPANPPQGINLFMNMLLHAVVPVLAIVGWLCWGPRIPFKFSYILWSLVYGVFWITLTLVRGALIKWYTYPFVNVDNLGYLHVAINLVVIAVFFVIVTSLIMWLDKKLPNPLTKEAAAVTDPVAAD